MNARLAFALALPLLSHAAAAKDRIVETGPADPCAMSERYVMPEGVEVPAETPGIAPADLPGTRSGYALPPKIVLDLGVNPLGPSYGKSVVGLGEVEIDRKTGRSTIDGKPLGGSSDVQAACAQTKTKR